jgi:hypothetical protein
MAKRVVTIWQFVAGETRSAPLGIALALAVALVLERAHAPGWSIPLVFTVGIAGALLAAVRESA